MNSRRAGQQLAGWPTGAKLPALPVTQSTQLRFGALSSAEP